MVISKEVAAKIFVDISEMQDQHGAELNQFNMNGELIDSGNFNCFALEYTASSNIHVKISGSIVPYGL